MTQPIALILLASGLSKRFGGDKLVAPFSGSTLLGKTSQLNLSNRKTVRMAVIGKEQQVRQAIVRNAGWGVVDNPHPEKGQATSLVLGVKAAEQANVQAAIVLLGDMPLVPQSHLEALVETYEQEEFQAILTKCDNILSPPAIFDRSTFDTLKSAKGDRGAGSVMKALSNIGTIPLNASMGLDIDTQQDLKHLETAYG